MQQLLVQPDGGPERPHGDGEDGDEDGEGLQEAQHAVDRQVKVALRHVRRGCVHSGRTSRIGMGNAADMRLEHMRC